MSLNYFDLEIINLILLPINHINIMRNTLLLFSVFIFFNSFGQNALWNKVSEEATKSSIKMERASMPSKYVLYSLNLDLLKSLLLQVPLDTSSTSSNVIIAFPNPTGELEEYKIYEAPIMEKGLADKFPNLKTYVGKSIKNPADTIRFSITVFGLHVMSLSGENGTFYIDTYTKDLSNYIVYKRQDVTATQSFHCDVIDSSSEQIRSIKSAIQNRASDSFFRSYRLAIACTIEYAAFHITAAGLGGGTLAQKKAAVLSAMVITMARVNSVFENDMSLRMNLVANNDLIIFVDSDSFDNSNSSTLINQSQTVIDATIGSANYDIGHTVSTGGGGLAQLNSPCGSSKARGITGQGSPVGDPFDIDYVAHEMGHQWGGNHTQNNACNRNATTAVEPGSASTIMGYAGICAPNVQSNSDAYFHTVSISEMTAFISGTGGTCADAVANGNTAPNANAGIDYTIPKGTAFILKGTGSDTNGDTLTYCWEQTNNETSTQPPTQTALTGPNFRSIAPSTSPNRYMPPLASVVANVLNPTWEVVPTVARTMNFALTIRDNRSPNGGQTKRDDMVLTVANVGPFLVTSPNTAVSIMANTNQTITWDIAGTTANGINCANVDILLSTNGGITFPTTLLAGTPNDGSQAVLIPNSVGSTNRIMIVGSNHIFYDVSNTNFIIIPFVLDTTPPSPPILTASGTTSFSTNLSWSGATDNIGVTDYDVYRGAILIGTTSSSTFVASGLSSSTLYSFSVRAKDANGNVSVPSNTVTITTLAPDLIAPTPPTLSSSLTTTTTTTLSWSGATDNVGVTSYDVYRGATFVINTSATTYLVTGLTALTSYTFTVIAKDASGNSSISSNAVTITTLPAYCASQGNSIADESIGNVQLGTINNPSTGGSGYTDFTAISTNLVLGSTNTITITPFWTSTVYNEAYAVFIDYNRDGDFLDVGETVYTRTASKVTPISGTFIVPNNVLFIGTTRMRVSMKYYSASGSAPPTSCETFSFGQVEDYSINFLPASTTLNLKLFIEGYYDTVTDLMTPVKANQGVGISTTDVDDITVELRNATTFALVATTNAMLKTDGTANCTFSSNYSGSYYIAVKHRSAVQTWSATPFLLSTLPPNYDFTIIASKAYGSNMKEVETGVWALYTGDINQDEVVDNSDSSDLFVDIDNSAFGYLTTDLNGDGTIDNSDTDNFFSNVENSIYSNHP